MKYCNNGKHLKQATEFNKNLVNVGRYYRRAQHLFPT